MTLLWWWPQYGDLIPQLLGWLSCVVTAYFMLETNTKFAILRTRTQMTAVLYLIMMAVCGFLHPVSNGTLCQLCLIIAFFCLLHTYQRFHTELHTFHAALALSIGSLFWPPLLWLMPVMLWCQGGYLRALDLRHFGAALGGYLLPYIAWSTGLAIRMYYAILTTSIVDQLSAQEYFQPLLQHAEGIIAPFHEPIIDLSPTLHDQLLSHPVECTALVVMGLIGMTGFIHYLRKSYDDKIQVRMYHYSYMTVQAVVAVWLVLQPHYFHQLFPLFIAASVPAAAHFIALTHTWLTNAWVVLGALALVTVAIINISLGFNVKN